MSYTPSPNKGENTSTPSNPGSTPTGRSNFSGLRVDANRIGMTGYTANNFQTQDATGTPVTSPVAVNTTTTLTVPANAVSVTLVSVTNGIRISEDSTYSVYFNLPAATPFTVECANQQYVYLQSASGSTTVSFIFNLV